MFKKISPIFVIILIVGLFLFSQQNGKKESFLENRVGVNGGGVESKDEISIQKSSGFSALLGKYHQATWDKITPASVPEIRDFNLDNYPIGDNYNSDDYAEDIGEPISVSKSEMVIAIFTIRDISSSGIVKMDWYSYYDNALIFSREYTIPKPSYMWAWYSVYTFVGHFPKGQSPAFPHEIDRAGTYKVVITSPWGNKEIVFTVIGSTTPDTCSDSDGGKNYYQSGKTIAFNSSVLSANQTDFCLNSKRLGEFYCVNSKVELEYFDCPDTCLSLGGGGKEGRCGNYTNDTKESIIVGGLNEDELQSLPSSIIVKSVCTGREVVCESGSSCKNIQFLENEGLLTNAQGDTITKEIRTFWDNAFEFFTFGLYTKVKDIFDKEDKSEVGICITKSEGFCINFADSIVNSFYKKGTCQENSIIFFMLALALLLVVPKLFD